MTQAGIGGRRALDHVVMPVASLAMARDIFEGLGFLVAPDAVHPFGTRNACVFFADGTYVEPLAVAHRETCEAEAKAGAVFVARDQAFRFRRGTPGFSGIAFRSDDAALDLDAFRAAGIADGDVFQFSRAFDAPNGTRRALSFRLAFAADRRAPDLFFFACQALAKPGDRSALTRHPNGATGIARLVLSEPNPTDFQYFLQDVVRERAVTADSFGMSIATAGPSIDVLTPDGLRQRYGRRRDETRGLIFEGLVIGVSDLAAMEDRVGRRGIDAHRISQRLVVGLGEGCFLAFERSA